MPSNSTESYSHVMRKTDSFRASSYGGNSNANEGDVFVFVSFFLYSG